MARISVSPSRAQKTSVPLGKYPQISRAGGVRCRSSKGFSGRDGRRRRKVLLQAAKESLTGFEDRMETKKESFYP